MKVIFLKGLLFHRLILLGIVHLLKNISGKNMEPKNTFRLKAVRLPV